MAQQRHDMDAALRERGRAPEKVGIDPSSLCAESAAMSGSPDRSTGVPRARGVATFTCLFQMAVCRDWQWQSSRCTQIAGTEAAQVSWTRAVTD